MRQLIVQPSAVLVAVLLLVAACAPERSDPRVTLDELLGVERDEEAAVATPDDHPASDDAESAKPGDPAGPEGVSAPQAADRRDAADPAEDEMAATEALSPEDDAAAANGEEGQDREMGPGVTQDQILLGFQASQDMTAAFDAVGAAGSPPEERRVVEAVVDWVNGQGGIAGREVVPVIHETNPASGTFASQAQAACATFTEDNEVFAIGSSPVGGNDALIGCAAQAQTPLVEQNHWWFDETEHERYAGWLYRPSKMPPERGLSVLVDALAAQGFFDGATLGVARFDAAVFGRASENVLKPRLAAHGVEVEEEVEISTPTSVGDFGGMNAELNNAVLRFRSAGVDRILFLENAAIMSFFFAQQAESQGYRPTYGVSTFNTPSTLANLAPSAQLADAVGAGWAPPNDVFDAQHPGGNAAYDECFQAVRDAGASEEAHDSQGYYIQPHCDTVLFLRAAIEHAPALTSHGLRAGTERLGDAYESPATFATDFGRSHLAGAAAWAPIHFEDDCECFQYTGEAQRVP